MATKTNRTMLNDGMPAASEDLDPGLAYGNALAAATWGREASPTKWGDYVTRVATTVTGASVASHTHTAALPGPVLHVEATAGSVTGPKTVVVSAAPAAGQVRITTGGNGRDTLEFNAGDAVTECAYRQLAMPSEMYAKLDENTDPPIST